jgi:hypothetical protein
VQRSQINFAEPPQFWQGTLPCAEQELHGSLCTLALRKSSAVVVQGSTPSGGMGAPGSSRSPLAGTLCHSTDRMVIVVETCATNRDFGAMAQMRSAA